MHETSAIQEGKKYQHEARNVSVIRRVRIKAFVLSFLAIIQQHIGMEPAA